MRSRAAWATTLALLVLGTGCDAQPAPPTDDGPAPTAELGFTQLLPLEGTSNALLRVTNTGGAGMDVTAVSIEWPGYPSGAPSATDATIAAGQTLDLRLALPPPDCAATTASEVVGVVESEQGTVRHELEPTGTTYVERLWRTQCAALLITESVDISYSARWSVVGEGVRARALGAIVLRRRSAEGAITVGGPDGSVLHDLRLPGPTTLAAAAQVARIPLEITPGNRCDEHARGQATAPFDFLVRLTLRDHRPVPHQVVVPLTAMNAATEALDVACAARAG